MISKFLKIIFIFFIIFLTVSSFNLFSDEKNKTDKKNEDLEILSNLKGTVVAIQWDANDNVLSASFMGENGKMYLISSNAGKGKELFALDGEEIEVSGKIQNDENDKNKKIIIVFSYKKIVE